MHSNLAAFANGKQSRFTIAFVVKSENQCLVEGRKEKRTGRMTAVMVEADHLMRGLQALPNDTNGRPLPGEPVQLSPLLVA